MNNKCQDKIVSVFHDLLLVLTLEKMFSGRDFTLGF